MRLSSSSSLGAGLSNLGTAYCACVVMMLILAAGFEGLGAPGTNTEAAQQETSWCQKYNRLHRRPSTTVDACTLCCSHNITTGANCRNCQCQAKSQAQGQQGTLAPTQSPTATPSTSNNVCAPATGCNVCQQCCQEYISPGANCDSCVQTTCTGTGGGAGGQLYREGDSCSFSTALWLVWMTWHGSPLGDVVPVSNSERFVAVVAATCGFLTYPLFAVSMLCASTSTQYKQFITSERARLALTQLGKFYAFLAVLLLILAALVYEVGVSSEEPLSWCEDYHDFSNPFLPSAIESVDTVQTVQTINARTGQDAMGQSTTTKLRRECHYTDALFMVWMVSHAIQQQT